MTDIEFLAYFSMFYIINFFINIFYECLILPTLNNIDNIKENE